MLQGHTSDEVEEHNTLIQANQQSIASNNI